MGQHNQGTHMGKSALQKFKVWFQKEKNAYDKDDTRGSKFCEKAASIILRAEKKQKERRKEREKEKRKKMTERIQKIRRINKSQ